MIEITSLKEREERTKKKQRQFGNHVQAKNRISGDVKRCLDTAVSGTLIQVTSYPGARPSDAFTSASFRFVPLPRHSFLRLRERIASSHHHWRPSFFTCLLMMIGYQRNHAFTITSGSKKGILTSHLMIMYASLRAM